MFDTCRCAIYLYFSLLFFWPLVSNAAHNDWAEGMPGHNDGATRDYYNRGARLPWKNELGDWRDATGAEQGNKPFATATLEDRDRDLRIEWDVTKLVGEWLAGKHQNQGFFLRPVSGGGTYKFHSRESSDRAKRPVLILVTVSGTVRLEPVADTYLEPSTYRPSGTKEILQLSGKSPILLRFDLDQIVKKKVTVKKATLVLHTFAQYGGPTEAGVFRCSQGEVPPPEKPIQGLAVRYPRDRKIDGDPAVIFATDFGSSKWNEEWTYAGVMKVIDTVARDPARKFAPLLNKALRVKIATGSNSALNTLFKFRKETGSEPEEIYFRYYLRLADDWNQTLQGGKMPGISGTYGVAGWGGRKSDGTDGWSARGSFHMTIPAGNPLGGLHPIGTYCYHADMKGTYGDSWIWQRGYRGYLESNRWYCIEQYLKLNTPGKKDGILRAWIDGRLAFEKTDIRFRHVSKLKIEQIWMNVYHGGKKPSPHDQHLYIDNVVIAREYIGPLKK